MENESRVRSQPLSEHYGDATSTCSGLLEPCKEDRCNHKKESPTKKNPACQSNPLLPLFH